MIIDNDDHNIAQVEDYEEGVTLTFKDGTRCWRPVSNRKVKEYMTIEDTLKEREKTHGDFFKHARCTQHLKEMFKLYLKAPLNVAQQEALEMIFHKIGRIATGDPDYPDHWKDIAGYATLAARQAQIHTNEQSSKKLSGLLTDEDAGKCVKEGMMSDFGTIEPLSSTEQLNQYVASSAAPRPRSLATPVADPLAAFETAAHRLLSGCSGLPESTPPVHE